METYNSIELTKQLVKDGKISQEIAETIFPELKESEDERIRKEIIGFLDMINKDSLEARNFIGDRYGDAIPDNMIPTWIAWLGKQGEHIKFLKSIQIGDEVTRNPDGILVNLSQFKRMAEQGSQNLANSAKTCKVEQKPADNEPKFKVRKGKWYVCTKTFVSRGKIIAIKGQTYQSQQEDDTITCEDECLFIDRHDGKASDYFRYWTIEDAKDGDVLCSGQIILLFKKWESNDWNFAIAHAGIDVSGKLQITDEHWLISNHAHPATQEQCDLLFQKMKEAGYEWDDEKKELRKIEQNHAWSEEDERMINSIIKNLDEGEWFDIYQADWLKSLKERYTWKPTDEQMEYLSAAIEESNENPVLESLYNDLKKLKG